MPVLTNSIDSFFFSSIKAFGMLSLSRNYAFLIDSSYASIN